LPPSDVPQIFGEKMGRNCNTILVVENYSGKVVVAKQTRYTFPK
jgi:hypothetical protein